VSINQVGEVLRFLCSRFPKTFFAYQVKRRPLKLGIHRELETILGETVDRKLIHRTLRTYVSNYCYLRSQKIGAERIDLNGNPAGVVTAEEAENAKKSLAGINAKRKQKRLALKEKKPEPRRDGLAALREAAAARRRQAAAGGAA